YSIGNAKGNNDVGGFIGYVNKSSIINCFSNAKADGNSGIASFVGQTHNQSTIKNNITLVNQFKGYKFDGRTGSNKFVNFSGNYENEANAGTSTLNRTGIDFSGKIDVATAKQVETESFYTETLGWDKNTWDFSKVSTRGIPKLRNSDPNDNSFAVKKYHIKSADEFIDKIKENPYAMFIIDNDIDFSSKDTIVEVEFRGILEGNGYKLTGNKKPIFNQLNRAKITGVILEGSRITSEIDNVGVLAKTSINSEIEDVHVIGATITGANSKVGGIVGYAENSTLKASSSNVSILASGNDVGGLVGEITNSTIIENCYSLGLAQGNENVGGLVGNVDGSSIKYSYSTTSVNGIHGIAGFIGQSTANSTIENNIALGNQNKHYKFDGKTEKDQFVNYLDNYEYGENRGQSTLLRQEVNFNGKIGVATKDQITSLNFYIDTLGWDENIWDLSSVTNEYTPKLKNLDPNKPKAIGVYKGEINSVEEFITELTAHPTGEFTIMADLDFSSKVYNVGSVLISGIFEGVIKGEGHTIRNLKNATIFEQFNGEVDNLNVEKFDYGAVYWDGEWSQYVKPGQSDKTQNNVAVFAKKSFNATYSNMKLNKITIFGNDNVAVLVSIDKNSTFENIDVSQAYVNAGAFIGGHRASTFISEKTGGYIKNCYVQGELASEGQDSGGIIAIAHGNVTIENVISNIHGQNGAKQYVATNGLFIGKMDATTVIKNSASLGSQTRTGVINKFVGTVEDISTIQNCYEDSSINGTSNDNGINIKGIDKGELKDKNFYVSTLGFDETIWKLDDIVERYYTESVRAHGQTPESFPRMLFFGLK
ncbi:MAG: ZmpA/ZmpB/ZmpC family metallo-endopeptidase-related protein, partial [Clostridium sp.]